MQPKISFKLQHTTQSIGPFGFIQPLIDLRNELYSLGLIGHDKKDPLAYPYGNISFRLLPKKKPLIITASQTSQFKDIGLQHLCQILDFDIENETITSAGIHPPSSESLSHAAIYETFPEANYVIHIHSKCIWEKALALDLLFTSPDSPFGSKALAKEILNFKKNHSIKDPQGIATLGHEDGILLFSSHLGQLRSYILSLYSDAKGIL